MRGAEIRWVKGTIADLELGDVFKRSAGQGADLWRVVAVEWHRRGLRYECRRRPVGERRFFYSDQTPADVWIARKETDR